MKTRKIFILERKIMLVLSLQIQLLPSCDRIYLCYAFLVFLKTTIFLRYCKDVFLYLIVKMRQSYLCSFSDLPSIVSGSQIGVIDPHEKYFSDENGKRTGHRW